jgi:2,3-bisphosphoglycerate-independent phosphoglycerate mutase
MFGYRMEEFPGRGLVEALGEGFDIRESEVALLARIFSVAEERGTLILRHEDPELDPESCRILHGAIRSFSSDGITAEFLPTRGIGGILRLRGEVSKNVTDSNPITEGRPLMAVHPLNGKRRKKGLPPINAVGTQRAGMPAGLPSFSDKWGLRGLLIASGAVYQGLGQVVGMDACKVSDSDDPARDLRERLEVALKAKEYDFVHVHTKVTDTAGHTGDPLVKKSVIEQLDRALEYALTEIVPDEDILFIVTADHSTASSGTMIHTGESVPLVMSGKYIRRDDVGKFDEVSCAAGGLSLVRGKELMYLVLNFLDRGKLWGLMDSPDDQPFTPGSYTALRTMERKLDDGE